MLIRHAGDDVVAIGQASHAWLSGQLARVWGNRRFDPPEPWEEVCLAAQQHDVGMAEWDLAPKLDSEAGTPQSFTEMALEDHLRLWTTAPEKLLTQSRYAALLVSLHGTTLYERRDLDGMAPADARAVGAYLAGERARQEHLIGLLGANRSQLERNQRLLFALDGLSLALCLRWSAHVAEEVPSAGEAGADVRLEPVGGEPDRVFVVDPWPFSSAEVIVRCEGRRLAGRHETEAQLHAALAGAPHVPLSFRLVPSSPVR